MSDRVSLWSGYIKTLLLTILLSAVITSVWLLLVDPYDSLWFSPPLERAPVAKNQRFAYPGLARSQRFDSLIVGTSTVRLLRPDQLDPPFGASFVNLGMNGATPFERSQVFSLFVRHHPEIRYAIIGIDDTIWCSPRDAHQALTERPFPFPLYDENRWNDLSVLFDPKALGLGWSQFLYLLGRGKPRFGIDGYKNFMPDDSMYDIGKARIKLYEETSPDRKPSIEPLEPVSSEERAGWAFPDLNRLQGMLHALPKETAKAVLFPPYHQFRLPEPGSRQAVVVDECKARIARIANTVQRMTVIDFMIRSRIALKDENFWDPLHYRAGIASLIQKAILNTLEGEGNGQKEDNN